MSQHKFVGALAGLALLAGCGGGEGSTPAPETTSQGMTWEQFLSVVYQEPDTGVFIADGDTLFTSEKALREFYEQNVKSGQLIVHTSGGVDAKWSDTQKKNITYCVSTTFGSNYSRAVTMLADAAAAWEQVANVDFVYVSSQDANCTASNTNVVFDVRPVNSGGQYMARAFFPNESRAYRNVLIDNTAWGGSPPVTLLGIIRHELGHTLGFRHEHTRPESGTCFEDNSWRALTTYDSASVMHYPHCNGSQTGDLVLTAKDIQGAQALYGAPGTNPPPPPTGTPATDTRSGSIARNGTANFGPYTVLAGTTFKVVMTGTGDPDLYVRFGAAPTTTAYNCRPFLGGAAETCELTVPSGQTSAYVQVRGYAAGTYSLNISYTKP
ncbi:M57 family metalloprotease [Pyxidicoccus xibeiensis]|uniref:M57 family metalloprotease n=1 Tax=Pyxidicoccus xibeiensis TaxID=2906759 RepID=UPI0020A703F3|nr:M57 family metalloprotease [Pyxidicoccus xibeiensis]MCP3143576.1 M57 family metalloprotease [Pyxidicoccus xibeiensis]